MDPETSQTSNGNHNEKTDSKNEEKKKVKKKAFQAQETDETLDEVCRQMSQLVSEAAPESSALESEDLVSAINYNTITSLAALKDILQGEGNDTPEADNFFQHYFMNHCNTLSSRNSVSGSPFPFAERRRLSQCREEDEDEREPPPSAVSSRASFSRERTISEADEALDESEPRKRTVMGARHKFLVTPTKPPLTPMERALRTQVHNSHTVHFGTKGAEEQRPSVRSIFAGENLHRDKAYFDSSLVEIRSTADGVTASNEDIWVKRTDVKPVSYILIRI